MLSNGNISLYLDIYYEGRRKYDFLKLYLIPEKTSKDKERNKETLSLANAIKAQRIVEIQSNAQQLYVGFCWQFGWEQTPSL